MSTMKLEKHDGVFVLTLTNGEAGNLLCDEVLQEYLENFAAIEHERGDAALVIISTDPKTFCNGINLPWLMRQKNPMAFATRLENFLIRLGLLNLPVVAAINGNAYAGGALIATASDFRLMRADRGRFCFSEVKIKLPFTPALLDIVRLLPNRAAIDELALTGNAWGGEECARREVVHQALPEDRVLPAAMALAADMATRDRATYTAIKRGLRPTLVGLAGQRGIPVV
ncbi:enoyl-CoA hydratase/isomerase family protein [Pseudomonas paralcaligenes]|uniref:enoyl-CoA hydratase/isomerase family protein n=1 Tax=Pseudomonas paralcaligenes TaxID=2772558 RepID=UPI001C7F65BD|nr:enoyl-CoA hydratase/isomerase family protein [Pseudomonas paralcaligenes]